MRKTVKKHEYMGKQIGRTIVREGTSFGERYRETSFETDLSESELGDLLNEMPITDKIHVKTRVPELYAALKAFRIDEEDYLIDSDLAIYVLERGFKNLSELNRGDKRVWDLIRSRG